MRVFSLSFFVCIFFAFTSCAENTEDQAVPTPETTPEAAMESDLAIVHDEEVKDYAFGMRTAVIPPADPQRSFHQQHYFLSTQNVKQGNNATGTSDMLRLTFLRRSAKTVSNVRIELNEGGHQSFIDDQETVLVTFNGADSMNFATGEKLASFRPNDGVILFSTNPQTGESTIYIDATAPDGREIIGTFRGNLPEVEVPFLQ